ncbi:hypothetical protein niasHS_007362 [Heterodera schachtii]|uniref:Apple domain-containing protein n=1 Tax=Heterodera schachtii TaxID=97005 RepID=A0ABD2JXF6_HETSC
MFFSSSRTSCGDQQLNLCLSVSAGFVLVIGQESYGAYAGLPAEGINGAGIAGNGASLDREGQLAQGVNIRKAPIAPVAPPRVPIPLSFIDGDEMPAYRRAPPPPTRRETRSEGQCQFDPNKWRVHAQSAVANAIMFDRTSGIRCDECLELCTTKYQDPSKAWVCRSVTYDHRWKICDLFAVNGTTSPYFLVDFKGRDYFDFLPALPPSDFQLGGLPPAEVTNVSVSADSQNAVNSENAQQLLNLTERDASGAEEGGRGDGGRQCLCPCKLLADKTELIEPKREEDENGTELLNINGLANNTPSVDPSVAPTAEIADIASTNASSSSLSPSSSDDLPSISPLALSSTTIPSKLLATVSALFPENATTLTISATDGAGADGTLPPAPPPPPIDPSSVEPSSPSPLPAGDDLSSSPPPAVSEPPNGESLSLSEANATTILATLATLAPPSVPQQSTPSFSPIVPTDSSNVSVAPSANVSSESAVGHRALSSKTFHQQSFREIRVPFHKTVQKLNKMGALSAKRPAKIHEVLKACPKKGQLAHYVEVSDHQRLLTARRGGTNSIEEIGAKDVAECMDACDAPIRLSTCNSAVFSAAHRCELSTSAANHSAPDSLLAAPKFKYVEKICLDASLSRGDDKRRVFSAAIGHILVGHVQEVFNAGSLSECIKACLMAESSYGFRCKSLMFYPTDADQNCLMNSESRFTQSDVFVQEDQNVHMLYVDMEQPRLPPSPQPLPDDERRRFKDIPIGASVSEKDEDLQKWTLWSKCPLSSSVPMLAEMRHRYLKCREAKDVRKCPKESMPCRKMPKPLRIQRIWKLTANVTAAEHSDDRRTPVDCLAVRDALGRKRCPYGMRWIGSQREFCSKPIDC